jgi:Zn-dependent alcohol dehydrogenase
VPTPARVVVLPAEQQTPLRIDAVELPDPGPHQVIVKQFASGICLSQIHQMRQPRTEPALLGHESTGVVLATGSAVSHVTEGDHVLITWLPRDVDRLDRPLTTARIALADGTTAVSRGVFTWADTTIVDEQFVVTMPNAVATDVTAIIGCAVMTGAGAVCNTANVLAQQSVAVFGVGGVGLAAIAAAAVIGAAPIIAVDITAAKLAFARRFGATSTVNAALEDAVARIKELTGGGADVAFDCIGAKETMEQTLLAVRGGVFGGRAGGTAVLVGEPLTTATLTMRDLLIGEKTYTGSVGGSCKPERDFPMFLRWYREGQLDLDALVTQRFRLDAINEATTALANGHIAGRSILEF